MTDFDPGTGEFLGQATAQGLNAKLGWLRGQAWTVYRFTKRYRETDGAAFLNAVRKSDSIFIASS